jgi:hypothetical protein
MKQLYIPQLETRQAKAEAALETAIDLLANVANLLRQHGNHNGDDARLANSIYAKLGEIQAVRDELNDAIEKREACAIEKRAPRRTDKPSLEERKRTPQASRTAASDERRADVRRTRRVEAVPQKTHLAETCRDRDFAVTGTDRVAWQNVNLSDQL